jgi:hypothetical protein
MEAYKIPLRDDDDDQDKGIICTEKPVADSAEKVMNSVMMALASFVFILGLINMNTLRKKKRLTKNIFLFLFYISAQLTSLCKILKFYPYSYHNLWSICIYRNSMLFMEYN